MSTITATIQVDDVSSVVEEMLRQFPKGARVQLAISEVPQGGVPVPSLDEYRKMVAVARQQAPRSPWKTTAEAMSALREAEGD